MTDAPIAQTIHPGNGVPAPWRQNLIAEWLTAHGVAADDVSADDPITVLTLPYVPPDPDDSGPWFIQVIVFTEYYRNRDGFKEANLLTRKPVSCQRTVPLRHAFPTDPTTDGEDHGEADRQAAQEAPEELVRHQEQAGVPDPRQGPCESSPVQGQAARNEGAAEGRSSSRHEAVPEPEEGRREEVGRTEEVGGDR